MYPITKSLRVIVLGMALLIACGPAIGGQDLYPGLKGITKTGRGADKIGWARKFRAWCKKHEGHPECDYVNSVVYPKCVNTRVKNFKDACPA